MPARFRRTLHAQLDPPSWPNRGLSPLNAVLCAVILLATAVAIL
jgi:hypothetical protein